jgi:malate permease and related proteins
VAALVHDRLRFDVETLSRSAFYLFVPALVFDALTNSDVSGAQFGQIAAVVVLSTAVLWLVGALAARPLGLKGATQAAFLNAILLVNAGNFGLSVNLFAFGEGGLARATVYFILSAVLSASLGVYISASGRASAMTALKQVATVPMVYATAIGLVVNLAGWPVPSPLAKAINLLGQASIPLMLAVLGAKLVVTLRGGVQALHLPALGVVTLSRLILAPALTWAFTWLVGLDDLARDVSIVQSAMPTAVITTILATEYNTDAPFAALCVLVTTLASLLSLTLLLNLFT